MNVGLSVWVRVSFALVAMFTMAFEAILIITIGCRATKYMGSFSTEIG